MHRHRHSTHRHRVRSSSPQRIRSSSPQRIPIRLLSPPRIPIQLPIPIQMPIPIQIPSPLRIPARVIYQPLIIPMNESLLKSQSLKGTLSILNFNKINNIGIIFINSKGILFVKTKFSDQLTIPSAKRISNDTIDNAYIRVFKFITNYDIDTTQFISINYITRFHQNGAMSGIYIIKTRQNIDISDTCIFIPNFHLRELINNDVFKSIYIEDSNKRLFNNLNIEELTIKPLLE
jgi:hypothetical protein